MVETYPGSFIRGLIHSDGCRSRNVVKGRDDPRYFFSNLSEGIRGLFVWACDLLGVECRHANARNISVARRGSVAILDELVGPKA